MSKGSKNKTQTQTTTSSPWAPTHSYLKGILADADEIYQGNPNPEFFPGQTFAQSGATTDAVQQMIAQASNPDGTPVGNINNVLNRTMSPDLAGMGDAVRAEVMPAVNSTFQGAGRSGSGLHAEAMAKGVARGLAPHALQANQQSLNAAQMAPGLSFAAPNQLYQAGILDEGIQQRQIDEDIARYDHSINAPWQQLGNFANIVQGQAGLGGTSTTTGTVPSQQKSPWQTALGLGLGGAGFFMGGPIGTSIGSQLPGIIG